MLIPSFFVCVYASHVRPKSYSKPRSTLKWCIAPWWVPAPISASMQPQLLDVLYLWFSRSGDCLCRGSWQLKTDRQLLTCGPSWGEAGLGKSHIGTVAGMLRMLACLIQKFCLSYPKVWMQGRITLPYGDASWGIQHYGDGVCSPPYTGGALLFNLSLSLSVSLSLSLSRSLTYSKREKERKRVTEIEKPTFWRYDPSKTRWKPISWRPDPSETPEKLILCTTRPSET